MSWDDHSHDDGASPPHSPMEQIQALWRLLDRSFLVGRILGIRVRVHITLVLYAAYVLVEPFFSDNPFPDYWWPVKLLPVLFVSVLLHEFGHCLACRRMGGEADDILMWPLGGLAYCAPPRRPWPEFVTVVWGPMVNLILAAAAFVILTVMYGWRDTVSFNPFNPWMPIYAPNLAVELVELVYVINYVLLLFNLALVFYPFDGGRMVQIAMWAKLGYGRSMYLACRVGMVGAGAVMVFALFKSEWLLLFIGMFGFNTCFQRNRVLKYEAAMGTTYDPGYYDRRAEKAPVRPGVVGRWLERRCRNRAERAARRDAVTEAEVDRILAKVKEQGLHSLTEAEKKKLQKATDRQRKVG